MLSPLYAPTLDVCLIGWRMSKSLNVPVTGAVSYDGH